MRSRASSERPAATVRHAAAPQRRERAFVRAFAPCELSVATRGCGCQARRALRSDHPSDLHLGHGRPYTGPTYGPRGQPLDRHDVEAQRAGRCSLNIASSSVDAGSRSEGRASATRNPEERPGCESETNAPRPVRRARRLRDRLRCRQRRAALRAILDALLEGLCRVRHRGAIAGDRRTGDGAGLLLPLPDAMRPEAGGGLAMVFLRDDSARADSRSPAGPKGSSRRLAGGARRSGPPRRAGRATMPRIEQLAARRRLPSLSDDEAEWRAYRARRRAERAGGAYIASLSFRTVTYKALCAADELGAFYLDLQRAGSRGPVRHLPPALLDEHGALLGAGTAVPVPVPQRGDQRDPGQRQLDAGP